MKNLKVIFRVTAIYMRKNIRRTLTAFAGILLMVVLMTAVFVGKDTVMAYLSDVAISDHGSWHIQAYDLNAGQFEELSSLPYMKEARVSRSYGYAAFPQSGKPDETPFLEIKGYEAPIFSWMNIALVEGRYPENENEIIISQLAREDGADLHIGGRIEASFFRRYIHAFTPEEKAAVEETQEESAMEEAGNGTGSRTTAKEDARRVLNVSEEAASAHSEAWTQPSDAGASGTDSGFLVFPFQDNFLIRHGETKEAPDHFPWYPANPDFEEKHEPTGESGSYTIVGFMESPYYELPGQGGYIALAGASASLLPDERVNAVALIDLDANASSLYADLADITGGYHGFTANDMLLAFSAKGPDSTINSLMLFFQAFFSLLIAVSSMVLIGNVFRISRRERSRYLGMLSSVGATGSQKRWSVYFEAFVLLIAALPAGLILGVLLVRAAMALLSPHFDALLGMLEINILTGRTAAIPYRLVVSPQNLLLTALLCILTVWLSALPPAIKVGKIGPVEAIRGNDEYRKKARTSLRLLSGRPLRLLALALVRRNRHMTRGIVQSLTLISSLTLITAFGAGLINDVIEKKASDSDITEGPLFEGYDYALASTGRLYDELRSEVLSSDEVTSYRESIVDHLCGHLKRDGLSQEYWEALREIVGLYFPEGIPADWEDILFGEDADVSFGAIILDDDAFISFAEKCGANPDALQAFSQGADGAPASDGPFLLYDTLTISTDNYRFAFEDQPRPGYHICQVRCPLKTEPGETLSVWTWTNGDVREGRASFAGYVTKEALSPYYRILDSRLWMVMPETTYKNIYGEAGQGYDEETFLSLNRFLLFNAAKDSDIVKRFSALNASSMDNPVIVPGRLAGGFSSIKGVIASIIRIVSAAFVFFVAVIGTLNLYNSVMGRKLARFREMAVLSSAGMTLSQRRKMLHLENALLFFRSVLYSALLTGGSVTLLRRMTTSYVGRMLFHTPYALIAAAYLFTYLLLEAMTFLCYRKDNDESILDRLRQDAQ